MTVAALLTAVAAVVLAVAGVLVVVRIVRGPTLLDRIVASDVLLTTLMIALAAEMVVHGHVDTLPVLVVLAGTASFATIAVARSVSKHDRADAVPAAAEPLATRTSPLDRVDPEGDG